jgi:predicted ATPase
VSKNLILPLNDSYRYFIAESEFTLEYNFVHDRVREAAYSLIPHTQRQARHLQIGWLLWQSLSEDPREERIFEIVNQLNRGIEFVSDRLEKETLAELNCKAGKQAKLTAAYKAAFNYFKIATERLPEQSWEEKYNLTLDLYVSAAEAAYLSGNFEQVQQWSNTVLHFMIL